MDELIFTSQFITDVQTEISSHKPSLYCNWINIYSFLRQMLVMYSCLWVKSTEYLGVSGCSGSLNISILLLRSQSLTTNWWVTNRGIWAFVVAGVLYLTCVHCTGTEWCSSCVLYSSQHLTLTLTLTLNEPPKLTLILNLTSKYTLLPPPKKQQQQTNKQQEAVPNGVRLSDLEP